MKRSDSVIAGPGTGLTTLHTPFHPTIGVRTGPVRSDFYTANTPFSKHNTGRCIFCDRQAHCTLRGLPSGGGLVETTKRRVIGRSLTDIIRNS